MRSLIIAAVLLMPVITYAAQFDEVLLTSSPDNPRPNQRTTITATLLGSQAADSVFTWLVDDTKVAEGIGATTLDVPAPALGKSRSIRVLINGVERSKPFIMRPSDVTILWEGQTETPPFYGGGIGFGGQGTVRLLAVPELVTDGVSVPSRDIRFTWKINGSVASYLSGYGKDTAVIKPPFYTDAFTVTVIAESRSGIRAERSTLLRSSTPSAVIYEISPLGGLHDSVALTSTYSLATKEEASFVAYPLNTSRPDALQYEWTLNGSPVSALAGDPRKVVFRKTGSGTGQYRVGLNISSQKAFLDLVQQSFLLHF